MKSKGADQIMELLPNLDATSKIPYYVQLYEYLKLEIHSGTLKAGQKLPSVRNLAEQIGVSRNTVDASYQQLLAEGYLEGRIRSGYYVTEQFESFLSTPLQPLPVDSEVTNEAVKITNYRYNFFDNIVDRETFPYKIWSKLMMETIHDEQVSHARYGHQQGEWGLRNEIAKYLHRARGVRCSPERIVLGAGTQVLTMKLALILSERDRSIAFEEPGYHGVRMVFERFNYAIMPIPLEADGLSIEKLYDSKASLVFVTPSHQSPYGIVMQVNKRMKLLQWARKVSGYIIEDDYNGEFKYGGHPIPAMQGLDENGRVIYLGTFSKALLPALRISYMVLPEALLHRYRLLFPSHFADPSTSQLEQLTLWKFIGKGYWDRHIRKMRKIYHKKYLALVNAIQVHMMGKVKVIGHPAGTNIVIEVKTTKKQEKLLQLAKDAQINLITTERYWYNPSHENPPQFLLGFGGVTLSDIEPAIRLLRNAWFADEE